MKHATSLLIFFAVVTVIGIGLSTPVAAHDSFQAARTPTPTATKTPAKQPTLRQSASSGPVLRSTIVITRSETGTPGFAIVSANLPPTSSITATMRTLKLPGAPLSAQATFAPSRRSPSAPGDFVDNWELLVNDNFEGTFPNTSACVLRDFSNDGFERYWGQDSLRATSGTKSIWSARGGANGVDPATNNYPKNLDSWLICGPYDFTNAKRLMARYQRWLDIPDLDGDFQFFGASTDGTYFNGVLWYGVGQYWVEQTVWFDQYAGQPQVWVALVFRSDNDDATGKGAWIDDLKVWRYNNPTVTCGNLDPGNKGVHLSAYEMAFGAWFPTIRAGDVQVVQGLMAADAKWVRLPFLQKDGYAVDEQAYDRMVDTLCNAGISVLGMINHETLTRPLSEADNDATAASYRQEFANQAGWLAGYFNGRVGYWEVWNEPRFTAPLNPSHYAALLTQTSNSIKSAIPDAKVLFAGLEHAWNDYDTNYFAQVYDRLDNEQGHARPFDIFAIHPYRDANYSQDPTVYMLHPDQMRQDLGDRTLIDKFVRRMEQNGDTGKKVWITEVGWNSALGEQNAPTLVVDKTTQAFYLQKGFDILLNQARSVDKVFWYKYQDEITQMSAPNFNRLTGEDWRIRHPVADPFDYSAPSVAVPGFWGLYTHINKLDPKPSRCAFQYYPQRCPNLRWNIFLPVILRGQ